MQLPVPPPEIANAGLRALKTVAEADGVHDLERRLVAAVQKYLLRSDFDLDALAPITPAELAAAVPIQAFRERIIRGCILVSMVDGEATDSERAIIDAFATALQVETGPLRELELLTGRHLKVFRFDVLRRSSIGNRMKSYMKGQGPRGFVKVFKSFAGLDDPALAARYQALRDYPEGTLGREYARFIDRNGFAFPGEPGGAPEPIVFHDCTHVLAGYGTSVDEETQIASFQAGLVSNDPFYSLVFVLAQFQLGVQITPSAEGFEMQVDPAKMIAGFIRGAQVNRDLSSDWEPWDDFHRPVDELRAEFNIPPRNAELFAQ